MFQIDEDEFSFGDDEDFWSKALEVEASSTAPNSGGTLSNSRISKGSLVAGNQLQQNWAGPPLANDASEPAISHPLAEPETFEETSTGAVNSLKGHKFTRTLQEPYKELPVTPGYQGKRKFSFKQKSPRDSPDGLSTITPPEQGRHKKPKQDGPASTTLSNSCLSVVNDNDKPKTLQDVGKNVKTSTNVTKGNLRVPINAFTESAKVNGSDNIGSSRPGESTNRTALQKLPQTSGSIVNKIPESYLQTKLSLPARCEHNQITSGQSPSVIQRKSVANLPFDTESFNLEDELNVPDDYFDWDPIVPPSTVSTTQELRHPAGLRSNHDTSRSDVAVAPKPTSHSTWNLHRPSAMQTTTSLTLGQHSRSSINSFQETRPCTSTSSFCTPHGNQNPSTNFAPQKPSHQGNLARTNFQPCTSSQSYPIHRPVTQHQPRSNTPMRTSTPGYTSPLPSYNTRVTPQSATSTPRMPNTIHQTPRPFLAPTQSFNSSTGHQRMTSPHQGDKPFTTHGAKPQNRGTPSPQTPLLTSRVAQLIQTPPSTSSGSLRTRVRKFPGPAGVLPKLAEGQRMGDLTMPLPENDADIPSRSSAKEETLPCSQDVGDIDFTHGAWQTMKMDLDLEDDNPNSILAKNNIASVLRKASLKQLTKNKVPHLCVLIKAVTFSPDVSVVLRDPTGEMQGTVHKRLVEEHQTDLKPGTVLVLKQVGVLSPSQRNHYLNITLSNLIQIYPSESLTSSQSSQRTPKLRTPGRPARRPSGDCTLPVKGNQNTSKTPQTVKRRHDSSECRRYETISGENTSSCLRNLESSGLATDSASSVVSGKQLRSCFNQTSATGLKEFQNERTSACSDKRVSSISGRLPINVGRMQSNINTGVSCKSTPLKTMTERNDAALGVANSTLATPKKKDSDILTSNSASRSEDITELLADIGDDFFGDF